MADLLDRNALFSVGRRYIVAQSEVQALRITPQIVDVQGSDANLIVGQSALMGEALSATWARCIRALFIDKAKLDELDRIAADRFMIARKPASAATVDLALARPTSGAGGGVIDAGTRVTTPDGSIFATDLDVTFGPTDLTATATATAQIVGPTMNVPAGALSAWADSPFDGTITVTNPGPAAGGSAAETDPQFRGRIRSYFVTIRRGTLGAIQYAATTIPGVSVSSAVEIVNPGNALPAGAVLLTIADDSGNASTDMLQQVTDTLLSFRAAGIPVFVQGGTVVFEQVVYQLAFESGIDTEAAASEVTSVAVAMTQFLRPGQVLLRSDLIAAARAVPGVIVQDVSLVAPVGDIVPATGSTILRVRAQDVSFQ